MARLPSVMLLAIVLLGGRAFADPARFDLAGPKVDVRVTRGVKALPVASVPNLAAGDKIWLHPDLPPSQSVRYLMVVAFLRGTTNPPPDDWFTRIETWNKKVREEGVEVTVPAEAEQAIVFLAPVTGGDFTTLRSAVRGRPGVFVRASQDLNEAGFEQGRIEKYLASIRQVPPGDARAVAEHSALLARTLTLRPNPDCFKREPEQQVTCLTQTGSQTLLDDGHGQTVVAALTTGASSDLISAASYTQMAGGGVYSAYVGAIVDLARLLGGLHTAQYQYIPAIALPEKESLNLRLNTPPSFHNPKSVIVIGLPAIQKAVTPPLRSPDAHHVTCLLEPRVVIPLEGAPLVFSTEFAHDLRLRLNGETAREIPLSADAYRGGLTVDTTPARRVVGEPKTGAIAAGGAKGTATIVGSWGFDPFEGPTVPVQMVPGSDWRVKTGEPLIAGHDDRLVLTSTGSACLESVTFDSGGGASLKVSANLVPEQKDVEVDLPLASAAPGSLELAIHQFGGEATRLAVKTYSDPAKVEGLSVHAGDRTATLTGKHLDQVREVVLGDVRLTPAGAPVGDALPLGVAAGGATPGVRAGSKVTAKVTLADGRVLELPVTVDPARPALTLRGRSEQRADDVVKLAGKDDLRVDEPVTLILQSETAIPRSVEIEVATSEQNPAAPVSARLTFGSGALVLQDARTLRVTFDPLKVLGLSVFGPVRLRALEANAGAGDWIPLGTLVRVPSLTGLACPADPAKGCTLSGSGLYLIDAVGNDAAMSGATVVPEAFTDASLTVPRPVAGVLYLRLRDDRDATATATLPVQAESAVRATGPRGAVAPRQ